MDAENQKSFFMLSRCFGFCGDYARRCRFECMPVVRVVFVCFAFSSHAVGADEPIDQPIVSVQEAALLIDTKPNVVVRHTAGVGTDVMFNKEWKVSPEDWFYVGCASPRTALMDQKERDPISISVYCDLTNDELVTCLRQLRQAGVGRVSFYFPSLKISHQMLRELAEFPKLRSFRANNWVGDISDDDWSNCIRKWPDATELHIGPGGGGHAAHTASLLNNIRTLKFENQKLTESQLNKLRTCRTLCELWVRNDSLPTHYTQFLNHEGTGIWGVSVAAAASHLRSKAGIRVVLSPGVAAHVILSKEWIVDPEDWYYMGYVSSRLKLKNMREPRSSLTISINNNLTDDELVKCFAELRKCYPYRLKLAMGNRNVSRTVLLELSRFSKLDEISSNAWAGDITDEDWGNCISKWPELSSIDLGPNASTKAIDALSTRKKLRSILFLNQDLTEEMLLPLRQCESLDFILVRNDTLPTRWAEYLNRKGTGIWQRSNAEP